MNMSYVSIVRYVLAMCMGFVVSVVCSSWCCAAEAGGQANGALPRYAFKVGQELRYGGESVFKDEHNSRESASDWKVWVTRKNNDGAQP